MQLDVASSARRSRGTQLACRNDIADAGYLDPKAVKATWLAVVLRPDSELDSRTVIEPSRAAEVAIA